MELFVRAMSRPDLSSVRLQMSNLLRYSIDLVVSNCEIWWQLEW